MIYKFQYPVNLFKEVLNSFKGYYNALYIPKSSEEKFCYASLAKSQIKKFLSHFGANGGCVIADNSFEYPGSKINKMTQRISKFIFLEHRSPINKSECCV